VKVQLRLEETLAVNYEVQGNGPDIVLVHGLGLSSMKTWRYQVPALSSRYRVHTYDVRGFGQTNNPAGRFSVQQHAYDLLALLDALGLDRPVLVGFSMGGWISQQFVLDHPERVRALVLSNTTSGLRPEGAQRFVDRAAQVEKTGMQALSDQQIRNTFSAESLRDNPALIDFYRSEFLDTSANAASSYAAMFRALSVPNWTPQLGRIQCPALILCGDSDQGITRGNSSTDAAEILHHGIAGSRFEVIKHGGHYAHLEQPASWNRIVLEFLDSIYA
jgi:3-oxoadipate enol-lactonase